MSVRRIAARLVIVSLSCLAISSFPSFAQTEFRASVPKAKRMGVLNRPVPASRPAPPAASSPRGGKIDHLIRPITIYYPSYTNRTSSRIAAEESTVPAKTPKPSVPLIKPITIYYRVPGPAMSKPIDVVKSSLGDSRTASDKVTPSPEPIPPATNVSVEKSVETEAAVTAETAPAVSPATIQLPQEPEINSPTTSETSELEISRESEPATTPSEIKPVVDSEANSKTPADDEEIKAETALPATETAQSPETAQKEPATENSAVNLPKPDSPTAEVAEKPVANSKKILPAIAANDTAILNNYAIQLTSEARYDEAARLLKRAIGFSPNMFGLHRNLSIVYENMRKMDDAIAAARKAVELAPAEPSALMQLCGLELLTGQNAASVTCYEKLRDLNTLDTLSQTFYGVALLRSDRSIEAIEVLKKALSTDPANAAALNALGVAHFNSKKFEDAVSFFKRAVEASPEHGEIRFNLAIAHLALRNKEGAMSQYRLLKEDDPKIAERLYRVLFRDKVVFLDKLEAP